MITAGIIAIVILLVLILRALDNLAERIDGPMTIEEDRGWR